MTGMAAMGYPDPRGNYWCVQLQWLEQSEWTRGLSSRLIDAYVRSLGLAYGEPTSALWGQVSSITRVAE